MSSRQQALMARYFITVSTQPIEEKEIGEIIAADAVSNFEVF